MKITVIAVGKDREGLYESAVSEFVGRIGKYAPFELVIIPTSDQREENEKILRVIQSGDAVVLLDERGKMMTSPQLAGHIEKKLNESVKRLVFIVGGAYGFGAEFRPALVALTNASAVTELSLSALTFPHQIARLVLLEQIYRAFTILKGEKYHHQ